ncbi:hypothetical protein SAMN05216376_12716 [Mameliella alba]|nr:hypothetical protein LX94_05092 [Mameliella alba]GGF85693.1 hypothetical protein GCM10011319_51920 [Mameliella alba]SDE32843.1 hypothetical protein SAMN05216376_12716 [Mameliella alba]
MPEPHLPFDNSASTAPEALILRAMALWLLPLFWLCHHEGQWCRKVWPNDNCFALRERRCEGGGAPVEIATGFPYGFPIPFVSQTMDEQGAKLA